MNFRRILTRKIAIVATLVVVAALAIALVAMPAGAINQSPASPGFGEILNSPGSVPTMINYQGYLTDPDGNPIKDTLEMTFTIYEDAVGGTALWTETHPSVTVNNGLFNVLLGSINPISYKYLSGVSYLGIQVGADPEMTPRQSMVSVAYAFWADMANDADTLDGKDSTDFAPVAHKHDKDYVNVTGDTMTGQLVLPADGLVAGKDQLALADGKVSIGTATPGIYQLWVEGVSNSGIYGVGTSYGIFGRSEGGIAGVAAYHTSGNYGRLATSNEGVYGEHGDSGNYGMLGTFLDGVIGFSTESTGYGVSGSHSSGNYGMLGTYSNGVCGMSSSGKGVYGISSTIGYGVYGSSTSGEGVYGEHATSGNYGKLGTSTMGIYGEHDSSGNYGYIGTSSYGVYGYHNSGNYGRLGSSTIGVYGYGTTGNYDFYAGGPGENYGPFTGAHEVKLDNNCPQDIRPGMIVSVTGKTEVRTDEGEISYSSTLPTVQLADIPNDKKVAGVIISESSLPEDHWYEAVEGERFGTVNALGEGRVWITNINGDIEAGDYITTSSIAGYGQKQDDDLLHSYTLGKAIETVNWSQVTETVDFNGQTYKAYAIAVFYTSG
jgi:hypothetical protein